MGEMSTSTTRWRCRCGLNRKSGNFFSHSTTEDEYSVWPKIRESFSSAYKQKIHPNRTPFRSKKSRSFPVLTLLTADEMSVLAENPKIFFCSSHSLRTHLLLGSHGGRQNLRANAKKEQKISPLTEKSCEKAARY